MAQQQLSGFPTFSGDVIKAKLNPGVTPTFNRRYRVRIFKVEPSPIPTLKDEDVKVVKVQPQKPTFNVESDIRIDTIRR